MSLVVVSGTPRSGTSMMMAMLEAGGIETIYEDVEGLTPLPDKYNPLGYFEHHKAMTAQWTSKDIKDWDGKAVKILDMITRLPMGVDTKVIIMRRNLNQSIASAHAMAIAANKKPTQSIDFWQGNLDAIRLWSSDKPHIEVWYDEVLNNTKNECLRVLNFLDLPLNLPAMASIVKKDYQHYAEPDI